MIAPRRFVILCSGRTGSTLLVESLRAAEVMVVGEIFHSDMATREETLRSAAAPYQDGEDGASYIESFFRAAGSEDEPVGFKLFYEQARQKPAASIWDYLRANTDIAVIHLIRQDLLSTWVSYETAKRTGVWVCWPEDRVPPTDFPIEVNEDELHCFFDRITAQKEWVRRTFAHSPFMEISYEDGLRDRFDSTMTRVLQHIGASNIAEKPEPAVVQISLGDPANRITNFDALKDAFRNSAHAHYFERPSGGSRRDSHAGFCPKPFEFLGVDAQGKLRVCCEDWLPTPIGDMQAGDTAEQWNSSVAVSIRESILDGSYRYCDAKKCPALVKQELVPIDALTNERHRAWAIERRTVLQELPHTLSLGYDPSCNLKCPTCRSDFVFLKGREFDRAAVTQEAILAEFLPTARQAIITGHGDAIASRLYRNLLRTLDAERYPNLRILLMTNGLGLDENMWNSFQKAHAAIAGVSISIDAASQETYTLNRGGKFDKVVRNLNFLSTVLRAEQIDFLEISFVVQANNFLEMPDFVTLARNTGCTSVLFMKMIHWPATIGTSDFAARAVHEPDHPQHQAFLDTLNSPVFGDDDIDLSNLDDLRTNRNQKTAIK